MEITLGTDLLGVSSEDIFKWIAQNTTPESEREGTVAYKLLQVVNLYAGLLAAAEVDGNTVSPTVIRLQQAYKIVGKE